MNTQAKLNREMVSAGITRYHKKIQAAREKEREYATGYGQQLISQHLPKLAESIEDWIEHNKAKKTRKHVALQYLTQLPSDVLAGLTLRQVLSSTIRPTRKTRTLCSIGEWVEDEIRCVWLKHQEPYLAAYKAKEIKAITKDRRKSPHQNLVKLFNKLGLNLAKWSQAHRYIVGGVLYALLEQVFTIDLNGTPTQLIYTVEHIDADSRRKSHKPTEMITLHHALLDRIEEYIGAHEALYPRYYPMVERPNPWCDTVGGGYSMDTSIPPISLVKNEAEDYQSTILQAANLSQTFSALNAIQDTPWSINVEVLKVYDSLVHSNAQVCGLPPHDDLPLPSKPLDIELDEKAFAAWKVEAHIIHKKNRSYRGLRMRNLQLIQLANKFAKDRVIYFPHYMDFRGRTYPKPSTLTPQGDDLSKALLHFARGKPIKTVDAANWLAVQGANTYGQDKLPTEGRLAWVEKHTPLILECAANPLDQLWWTTADKPWSFLTFCFEWAGYKRDGIDHVTRLPVAQDGSNNGLQILSLLCRDETCGRSTNCIPAPKPEDIYSDVADLVLERLLEDVDKPAGQKLDKKSDLAAVSDLRDLAAYAIEIGIDRSTCKRPVMVLPYGGTFRSTHRYVGDWVEDQIETCKVPSNVDLRDLKLYLARTVWDALETAVDRPRDVMTFLQKCASLVSSCRMEITWTTPLGLPVFQRYYKHKSKRVEFWTGDTVNVKKTHPRLVEADTTKLDRVRQRNGIAPNFVHSLDAACLQHTVNLMTKFGIKDFAVIHDSFGTLAPDVEVMNACIRKSFADIFTEDQLARFRDEIIAQLPEDKKSEVPPLPTYGQLNPRSVLESEYFFA